MQNIHPVVIELLKKRGLDQSQVNEFFSWKLTDLPDLTNMMDMEKTAKRVIEAMDKNQKIGIYGDYDVDGTTSCALFFQFFKSHNHQVELFQPSRFIEGYGVHPSSIEKALDEKIELLLTVDCGITNAEAATYAKERGLDLIITDHHKDALDKMPEAYSIVNPNRRDEPVDSELRPLAGVAVAFAICLKVKNILDARLKAKGENPTDSIYSLLQFVAIGTICDMAKLTPMNLKLTRHGLKQLPKTNYLGLKTFFTPEEREVEIMASEKISFFMGPMINSKGRLEHPDAALRLLNTTDESEARLLFNEIEICNRERKFIQKEVFEGAKNQVIKDLTSNNDLMCAIVYDEEWHEGVIGIVASRIVETFRIPAIIFTNGEQDGIIKASARTAGELDLFDCLNNCKDLFEKFGGHKAAAGLSMKKENLPEFKKRMEEQLAVLPAILRTAQDHYDLTIKAQDININLMRGLDQLEPFGMGNKKPIFRMSDVRIESYKILKDQHVKWTLVNSSGKKIFGISFFYINKWGMMSPEELYAQQDSESITVQFTLGINRFNGNEYIQLMVEKIFLGSI